MKKVFFIVFMISVFLFSIIISYMISSEWKKDNISIKEDDDTNEEVAETSSIEEKLEYDANFGLKKYYNECGHGKLDYAELPNELVNLNKEEIGNLYPDWQVEEFSKDNLILAQFVDSMCNEHYVIKMGKENVEVYNMNEFDDLELFKTTDINKKYLPEDDIKKLEEGIYVYGLGNVNTVFE